MESTAIQETCRAEGYPPPKLTWIRLVSPLPVGKTEVKEGNLTITNLRPVDSGLYQCVATNSMGTKKATMNLIVERAPSGLYIVAHVMPTPVSRGVKILINYPQKGRWIVVAYRDVKRRGIYLALFTDLEGDSCFSIYQISWIKIRKVTFCKEKTPFS